MDHLFAMYGIAMIEGAPDWDIYDGEFTYAGVTQNMKDALAFIHELYEEGLLDPETLLNDKAGWEGKIFQDRVGVYYHWAESVAGGSMEIENATGVRAHWVVLPPISAEGYEGFYTSKQFMSLNLVVKNTDDEATIDAVMKVLDAYGTEDLWDDFAFLVEGMHHEVVNGKVVQLPDDKATMENYILKPMENLATLEFKEQLLESGKTDETAWAYDYAIEAMDEVQQYKKVIAGDAMPPSVYDGYADILNRTLYIEYASKIITGEYDIDKFDEFVEKWYASGGEAVTEAARKWYAKTQQ